MDDGTHERWLPIVGYEGYYQVSSLGWVRGMDRVVHGSDGRTWHLRGKILAQFPDSYGHLQVKLCRDGKAVTRRVHQLVAEAFFGAREAGQETLHGPSGKQENAVTNLSYGTHIQNVHDRERDGTLLVGSAVPGAKLTEAIVRQCRARYASSGATIASLAAEYGVCAPTMGDAIQGKTWKHVGGAYGGNTRARINKLDEDTVRECRARHAAGQVTLTALAAEHGVSVATMHNAVKGKAWRQLNGEAFRG